MEYRIVMAGFGGQGVMFSGKLLAYSGMLVDKHITWFPSYGPEMRGGTANCAVVVSDKKIGSPIVDEPDYAVVMNKASNDKFARRVKESGTLFVNSSIVESPIERKDIKTLEIPANKLAEECGSPKAANIVLLGALIEESGIFSLETVVGALEKEVGGKRPELLPMNISALKKGIAWVRENN